MLGDLMRLVWYVILFTIFCILQKGFAAEVNDHELGQVRVPWSAMAVEKDRYESGVWAGGQLGESVAGSAKALRGIRERANGVHQVPLRCAQGTTGNGRVSVVSRSGNRGEASEVGFRFYVDGCGAEEAHVRSLVLQRVEFPSVGETLMVRVQQ